MGLPFLKKEEEKSMKKVLVALMLISLPVMAEEVVTSPDQNIENTKSYTGINYNRQDSEQVGTQKIVNDHSWFNINIQISRNFFHRNSHVLTSFL